MLTLLTVDISLIIIGEWCNCKDLSLLDSAYCNNESRTVLLKLLQSSLPSIAEIHFKNSMAALRNLKFLGLEIYCTLPNISIDKSRLNSLTFYDQPSNQPSLTALFINKCMLLKSMTLVRCDLAKWFCAIAEACKRLNYLTVLGCDLLEPLAFDTILNCSSLKDIVMNKLERMIPEGLVVKIFKNNHQLENIHLRECCNITNLTLVTIADHCPNITQFTAIDCNAQVTLSGVTLFMRRCRKLQRLEIYQNDSENTESHDTFAIHYSTAEPFDNEIQLCGMHYTEVEQQSSIDFVETFTKLNTISLEWITISTAVINAMISYSGNTLVSLSLKDCTISEDNFAAVVTHCQSLQSLIVMNSSILHSILAGKCLNNGHNNITVLGIVHTKAERIIVAAKLLIFVLKLLPKLTALLFNGEIMVRTRADLSTIHEYLAESGRNVDFSSLRARDD